VDPLGNLGLGSCTSPAAYWNRMESQQQSFICSTRSMSKVGDFCCPNVECPFDRVEFAFVASVYRPLMTNPRIQQDAICYQWFKQQLILSVSKPSVSQQSQIKEDKLTNEYYWLATTVPSSFWTILAKNEVSSEALSIVCMKTANVAINGSSSKLTIHTTSHYITQITQMSFYTVRHLTNSDIK